MTAQNVESGEESFPWHLGVFDAHCHPTDTMELIASIPSMKAKVLTVMATRAEDQALVLDTAQKLGIRREDLQRSSEQWNNERRVVPCFGWHPWFSHQMFDASQYRDSVSLTEDEKVAHYQAALTPKPDDRDFLISLPDPRPFGHFLQQTRDYLEQHPLALVGEVGLDKQFRIPEAWLPDSRDDRDHSLTPGGREGRRLSPYRVSMEHQKKVLKAQLSLAAEMKRAISCHSVQTPGIVFDLLQELWKGHEKHVPSKRERKRMESDKTREAGAEEPAGESRDSPEPYPPRICMHSYSGSAEALQQFLGPSVPVEFFFSFSTAINFSSGGASKAEASIKATPDHLILVESDLHTAGDRMDAHLQTIIRKVCALKQWTLEDGIRRLGINWKRFIFGVNLE